MCKCMKWTFCLYTLARLFKTKSTRNVCTFSDEFASLSLLRLGFGRWFFHVCHCFTLGFGNRFIKKKYWNLKFTFLNILRGKVWVVVSVRERKVNIKQLVCVHCIPVQVLLPFSYPSFDAHLHGNTISPHCSLWTRLEPRWPLDLGLSSGCSVWMQQACFCMFVFVGCVKSHTFLLPFFSLYICRAHFPLGLQHWSYTNGNTNVTMWI